jgi:hypothetical protein
MKRVLIAVAASALLLAGCSDDGDSQPVAESSAATTMTTTTAATSSNPLATSVLSATLCDQYCEQVEALQAEDCAAPFNTGSACSTRLTSKVTLAMEMEKADDGTDPQLVAALAKVSDAGEVFGIAKCYEQAKLDANCSMAAFNVESYFDIVAVRLGML